MAPDHPKIELDEERIASLVRLTETLPDIPPERAHRVHQAVYQAWREDQDSRSRAVRPITLLAAAVAGLALALAVIYGPGSSQDVGDNLVWGEVACVTGTVAWATDEGLAQPLVAAQRVAIGTTITSDESGRVSLQLANGASLRADHVSRFTLLSTQRIALHQGAIYVDSKHQDTGIVVQTPWGEVEEIGTQFEVRIEDNLAVRVREGEVSVRPGTSEHRAGAGQELRVNADSQVERRDFAEFGPYWDWVIAIAPVPDLDGLTVIGFLDWFARETGYSVRFSDSELALELDGVTLNGSSQSMTPNEALHAVLATSGLAESREGQNLIISRSGGAIH